MANTKVTGDVIANGTISTVHIADNVITSDKISGLTTAHITEGANLYYTDARARSAVSVSGNALSYNSSTGVITSNFEESPTFTGIITASSSSSGDYVRLYGSSGTGKWDIYGNGANLRISDNESAGILAVDTGATFGGNVGIGTTSPSHKLDVAGTIRSNTTEGKLILNSTATNGNEYQFISIDTGNLGIYDGTAYRLWITGSGNIGIGTTSPVYKLQVEDAAADIFYGATNATSGSMFRLRSNNKATTIFDINANGNVGIGTASPDSILHVESNGSTSANFILESTHSSGIPLLDLKGASSAQLRYKDSSDVIQARIDFDNSGTFNFIDVPNNSSTLYLKTGGNVGIGTTSPDASLDIEPSSGDADILLTAGSQTLRLDQNSIRTTTNNNLTLFTNGNSGQLVLQQSTGNVGIGTTSPAQKLHVVGKMQISDDIKLAQTNGRIDYDNGVSTGALRFWSTSGNSERMRITSAGNVGIGETSPLVPLHISRDSASGENIALLLDNNNTTAGNEIGILFRSAVGSTNTDFEIFGKANGANDMDLVFQSDGSVERMRINGDGNVGIGADSPGTKLEVRQVDDTFDDLDLLTLKRVWSTASGSDRAHGIKFSDNNAILANIYADRTNSGSNYNSDLVFITNTGASGTDTSEKMRIDNGGSIHQNYISGLAGTSDYGFTIAKQTGYSQVYFRADTTSTRYIQRFYNDNSGTLQNVGNIIISGSTTSYATSSDYRLKENVVEMTGALDRISQLKPSRFNFIGDADKTVDGFLAHEVQDIVPEAITGEKDSMRTEEYEVTPVVLDEEGNITEEAVMGTREVPEYQGIDQSKLVPLLVGAIQELKADNDSLRARIEILENQ